MARKNRIMLIAGVALMLMLALAVTASASSQGSIFLKLPEGTEVSIFKVADYDGSKYTAIEELSGTGFSVEALVSDPSAAAADSLLDFMYGNGVDGKRAVADGGYAKFSGLDQGIWLISADEGQKVAVKPFIVFIPHMVDGVMSYTVYAAPKTEDTTSTETSIYVMKRWDDDSNSAGVRPESITVNLLLDGEVIDSAELSSKTAWAYTFEGLEKSSGYSVEEEAVERYDAAYSGDQESGFVITNVYNKSKLPQTGDDWGPIVIIMIAALACMALCVINRKERQEQEE